MENLKEINEIFNDKFKGLTTDEIYHEISEEIQNIIQTKTKQERESK